MRTKTETRIRIRDCIIRVCAALAFITVAPIGFGQELVSARASTLDHTTSTPSGSWTTYGGSLTRDSVETNGAPRAPIHVTWRSHAQRGAIYGEPLVFDHRVYIATESDTVEALSLTTGRIIWSRSIGTPVPSGDLPCGDIGPTVGVTSTMVIDASSSQLFVSAETLVGSRVHHVLVSLSTGQGTTLFRRDIDRPHWSAAAQLQRAALGLDDNRVLVGFGGNYGDCGSYRGYLMAIPESNVGPTLDYQVPTARGGAIWAPAGTSVAGNGDIYLATGNGASHSRFDMSNAVVELSSSLDLKGWFAPRNWSQDSAQDLDLGSTAPIQLPNDRIFVIGKEGTGYLLDARHLGGIGGSIDMVNACNSQGGAAYANGYIYVPCPSDGMIALRLNGGRLHEVWHVGAATGSPTLGGGLVWSTNGNELLGISPRSGRVVDSLPSPDTAHFAAPTIANGALIVAGTSEIVAYR